MTPKTTRLALYTSAACLAGLALFAGSARAEQETIGPRTTAAPDPQVCTAVAAPQTPANLAKLIAEMQASKDAAERLRALQQMREQTRKPIPVAVSTELLRATLLDEDEGVRREAALAMKALDDKAAKQNLLAAALHPRVTEEVRGRGAAAIRVLDDPEILGFIVRLVTEDVKFNITEPVRMDRVVITGGTVFLPIHLPVIEIVKAEGLVVVPAQRVLRMVAQRDVGQDPEAWKNWFADWQQVRDARLKQNAGN